MDRVFPASGHMIQKRCKRDHEVGREALVAAEEHGDDFLFAVVFAVCHGIPPFEVRFMIASFLKSTLDIYMFLIVRGYSLENRISETLSQK